MKRYWQFKNGTVAPVTLDTLDDAYRSTMGLYECWDRSLGGWVHYT